MKPRVKQDLLDKVDEIYTMLQPGSKVSQRRIRIQVIALKALINNLNQE